MFLGQKESKRVRALLSISDQFILPSPEKPLADARAQLHTAGQSVVALLAAAAAAAAATAGTAALLHCSSRLIGSAHPARCLVELAPRCFITL